MKQKDIAMIIIVAFISGMFAFFISRAIFVKPQDKKQNAEVVEAITTEFIEPNPKYFNGNSINPTKSIQIGENGNPTPFNGQQ